MGNKKNKAIFDVDLMSWKIMHKFPISWSKIEIFRIRGAKNWNECVKINIVKYCSSSFAPFSRYYQDRESSLVEPMKILGVWMLWDSKDQQLWPFFLSNPFVRTYLQFNQRWRSSDPSKVSSQAALSFNPYNNARTQIPVELFSAICILSMRSFFAFYEPAVSDFKENHLDGSC